MCLVPLALAWHVQGCGTLVGRGLTVGVQEKIAPPHPSFWDREELLGCWAAFTQDAVD